MRHTIQQLRVIGAASVFSFRHAATRLLRRDRRGVAAVEFALAATPMMILIFGFVAISAVFNTLSTMQSNTQYAAQLMANGATATGATLSNVNGTISSSNTSSSVSCGSSTVVSGTVEYLACNGLPSWVGYTVTTSETCSTPSVSVSLSADAGTAAIADIVGIFTSKTISAKTSLMKEGSC